MRVVKTTKKFKVLIAAAVTMFCVVEVIGVSNAWGEKNPPQGQRPQYAPDELILRFKEGVSKEEAEAIIRSVGGVPSDWLLKGQFVVVRVPKGSVEKIRSLLEKDPNVAYAEFDYYIYLDPGWKQSLSSTHTLKSRETNLPPGGILHKKSPALSEQNNFHPINIEQKISELH